MSRNVPGRGVFVTAYRRADRRLRRITEDGPAHVPVADDTNKRTPFYDGDAADLLERHDGCQSEEVGFGIGCDDLRYHDIPGKEVVYVFQTTPGPTTLRFSRAVFTAGMHGVDDVSPGNDAHQTFLPFYDGNPADTVTADQVDHLFQGVRRSYCMHRSGHDVSGCPSAGNHGLSLRGGICFPQRAGRNTRKLTILEMHIFDDIYAIQ